MSHVETAYQKLAVNQMQRLLSRIDREKTSITYGCFDRTFWSWKFTDFPGPRFQEALYALAWMVTNNNPNGNEYFGNRQVYEWIIAGFRYWRGLQHGNGSFDEAYPYEHSLAATAFTSFYLGEAMTLLENSVMDDHERAANLETFQRAGDWLCRNDEYHGVLSNHLAAAAAALVVIHRLTGDSRFADRAQHFIGKILSRQSKEGWYEEYGGADIGYQTHGTFYLARIWALTQDEALLESLKRSVDFLSHFVHSNGTLGGEYGSRNTSFYFPAGFEILSSACPMAAAIAKFMRPSVAEQRAVGLSMMDAYNFCPVINNYLFAHDASEDLQNVKEELPFTQCGHWEFPEAGLIVHATETYQAIFAPSKGGVLKVYDKSKKQLALSDCGYWVELKDGGKASSQSFSRNNLVKMEPAVASVRCSFARINQKAMAPWLFLAFRLFTLTFGRYKSVAQKVKSLLVKVLVSRRKTIGFVLERSVEFSPTEVTINDHLIENGSLTGGNIFHLGSKFSTIHMGSARYFQPDELDSPVIDAIVPLRRTHIWKCTP